jgi:DNA-binding NtrC family response regulator
MSSVTALPQTGGPGPLSALVVDTDRENLAFLTSLLGGFGLEVIAADAFEHAKHVLLNDPPKVLVTAIRLAEYNGLHLVLRGRAQQPDLAAIIVSHTPDPVLRAEADAMGATFVVTPASPEDLLAAVERTLFQSDGGEIIRPPFERRQKERRADASAYLAGDRRQQVDRRRRNAIHALASLG